MKANAIKASVTECLNSLPEDILLVAAAKRKTVEEVKYAVDAGIRIVGHNYVQEAEQMMPQIGNFVKFHLIGHLQRNKAKRAVQIFDMIETIDSLRIAKAVNRYCADTGKIMSVLIEINSGKEQSI